MKSSRWSKTAALGCALFLALSTFLALCLGAASVASAQTQPPRPSSCDPATRPASTLCWPSTTGNAALTEEYSDIPWTQKLGTYRGNEFDQALVLPYGAIAALPAPAQNKAYCDQDPILKTSLEIAGPSESARVFVFIMRRVGSSGGVQAAVSSATVAPRIVLLPSPRESKGSKRDPWRNACGARWRSLAVTEGRFAALTVKAAPMRCDGAVGETGRRHPTAQASF